MHLLSVWAPELNLICTKVTKNQSNLTVVKLLSIIVCILRFLAGEDKFLETLQEKNLNICRIWSFCWGLFVCLGFFKIIIIKNMQTTFAIIKDERLSRQYLLFISALNICYRKQHIPMPEVCWRKEGIGGREKPWKVLRCIISNYLKICITFLMMGSFPLKGQRS